MKKYLKLIIPTIFSGLFLFNSCIPLKNYVYLQGDVPEIKSELVQTDSYRVQPGDNLYIQVISNDDLSTYFNLSSTDRYLNNDAAIELSSYKVDSNGDIDFPYLGIVHVEGLKTQEIKVIISKGVAEMLIQYSVVVKLVNRNISLLGEFNAPGTYSLYKDRATIFEVIGMAKDITDFGNRKKVKVIRHIKGERIVTSLDLTSTEIFNSEFYYIHPNDVIFVEPSSRVLGAKTLPFATILTSINTIVLLYNAVDSYIIKK